MTLKYALESLPELLGHADYRLLCQSVQFRYFDTDPRCEGEQLQSWLEWRIAEDERRRAYNASVPTIWRNMDTGEQFYTESEAKASVSPADGDEQNG